MAWRSVAARRSPTSRIVAEMRGSAAHVDGWSGGLMEGDAVDSTAAAAASSKATPSEAGDSLLARLAAQLSACCEMDAAVRLDPAPSPPFCVGVGGRARRVGDPLGVARRALAVLSSNGASLGSSTQARRPKRPSPGLRKAHEGGLREGATIAAYRTKRESGRRMSV